MNTAAKATGAAAGAAIALVDIAVWLVKLKWGIEIPSDIATDCSGLLTLAIGLAIHTGA